MLKLSFSSWNTFENTCSFSVRGCYTPNKSHPNTAAGSNRFYNTCNCSVLHGGGEGALGKCQTMVKILMILQLRRTVGRTGRAVRRAPSIRGTDDVGTTVKYMFYRTVSDRVRGVRSSVQLQLVFPTGTWQPPSRYAVLYIYLASDGKCYTGHFSRRQNPWWGTSLIVERFARSWDVSEILWHSR